MTKVVSYTLLLISLVVIAWEGWTWVNHTPEQLPTTTAAPGVIVDQKIDSTNAVLNPEIESVDKTTIQNLQESEKKHDIDKASLLRKTAVSTEAPLATKAQPVEQLPVAKQLISKDTGNTLVEPPPIEQNPNDLSKQTILKTQSAPYSKEPYIPPGQRKDGNLGGPPTPEMVFASPGKDL